MAVYFLIAIGGTPATSTQIFDMAVGKAQQLSLRVR